MKAKQLKAGKQYKIIISGVEELLYFLEVAEGYDHPCDCCNKDTMNAFIFCTKYYGTYEESPELYHKSWESGVYFIGGSSCLSKYVTSIN